MPELTATFDPALVQVVSNDSNKITASFHAIEQWTSSFDKTYYRSNARIAHSETADAMQATLAERIQAGISTFQTLQGRRISEHLTDLIPLLNTRRLYGAALTTRALIEVTATVVYYQTEVTRMLVEGIKTQTQMDELGVLLEKSVRGSRFDWARWLASDATRRELTKAFADKEKITVEIEQVNVLTMIKRLGKHFTEERSENDGLIDLAYGLLSDICHPSAGANLLQLANKPTDGWWIVQPEVTDDLMRWYCLNTTIPLVQTIAQAAATSLTALTRTASSIHTASST